MNRTDFFFYYSVQYKFLFSFPSKSCSFVELSYFSHCLLFLLTIGFFKKKKHFSISISGAKEKQIGRLLWEQNLPSLNSRRLTPFWLSGLSACQLTGCFFSMSLVRHLHTLSSPTHFLFLSGFPGYCFLNNFSFVLFGFTFNTW